MDSTDKAEIKAHCHRIRTEAITLRENVDLLVHAIDSGVEDDDSLYYKAMELENQLEKASNYVQNIVARTAGCVKKARDER